MRPQTKGSPQTQTQYAQIGEQLKKENSHYSDIPHFGHHGEDLRDSIKLTMA